MDTKQSKLRPCNQLIEQLKSEGLYLTDQKRIKLPVCLSPPPPSITTRLMSLLSNQKKTFNANAQKKIWSLQQNLVLITQANTLSTYILQKKENDCIDLQQKQKFHFDEIISAVTFPYSITTSDSKVLYFIVTYKKCNLISLFSIKNNQNRQITLQHNYKAKGDILTLQFISKSQFLIITTKHVVSQFKIEKFSLKFMREIENIKNLTSANDSLIFMKLLARPKEQQDSLIAIFYATWNSQTNKCELNIKEMFRQLDGNIYVTDPVYQIFSFTSSDSTGQSKQKVRQTNFYQRNHFEQVEVINQRDYFLLKLHHQIFVITKHFDKYVRLDAITQNFTSFKILMIQNHVPLICCIGTDSMQLWHVTVQSKKSNCTLMDVINIGPKNRLKQSQFIKFWVMNYRHKPQTIFAFDRGGRQIGFFGVKRIDKVSKLVNRITNSNEKAQIVKVQQLGKKLGVQRKSLYLKLWNDNPQIPANIYLYLLQSHDLPSIHSQLQKYMRKKFILTGQLIKIHTQIQNILIAKLKQELSFHNLKWLLKTNFQKRKLKLFSFDTQITFKEFQNIYNSSIFDLIQKNIDKKLFPEKSISKIPWNEKPIQDPDINVYHILQEFKLLILENYEQFLLRLLSNYRYNTAEMFEYFPDFLPKFPFKMEVFLNSSALNSQLMISNLMQTPRSYEEPSIKEMSKVRQSRQDLANHHSYQKFWFSEVSEQEWLRQKSSVDFIFNTLYPHYQTHQIMNLLTQLTESQWNSKKKYVTHCLIGTTINTFRQRVTKIQGLKLYLSVCEFVNRVKFQAQQKFATPVFTQDVLKHICTQAQNIKNLKLKDQNDFQQVSNSSLVKNLTSQAPKILQIMKQKKLLLGQGYETCILYSKMHDLMVTKEIMKKQTTIADLMTTSHSSLIAAFFIGERQRNSQLFKDFFPLYKDKNLFYQSLSQYINSTCCSRVQLQILVKQLHKLRSQHREYNSYLAELLIHGFCLRTQIREKHEAHEIILMFSDIELKLDLALKLQKFICIHKQLVSIFQLFMCDKLTYEEVLNQPNKVLNLIMENYFNSNLNWNSVKGDSSIVIVENKQIDLDIIENTFSILLYLKQKIYVEMSEMQLSLLYGEIMIEWQQFDVLKTVFSTQESSGYESSFTPTQYFEKLIVTVLDQIYTKQGIYMDEHTIEYIQNILSLLKEENLNPLIVREKTKLELSKLLQKWGYTIQSVTLELICIKWKEQNRQQLIIQIMDNCIQYFDLEALQNLYRLLQATRLGTVVRDIRNPESVRLAYRLAEKLAVFSNQQKNAEITNKQQEISKIIYFINKNSVQYAAQLGLMAQTFLKIVMKKYAEDPFILEAQLRSQLPEHVKFNEVHEQPQKSSYLAVRKPSISKLHKSFDVSQHNVSNLSRIKDKSYYDSKSFFNNGDMSKLSGNKRASVAQDPINGLHFDDPVVLQRVLNQYGKIGSETRKSGLYYQVTDLKDWHLKGRSMVEYFVLNWENVQIINEMFRNKFTRQVWTNNQTHNLIVSKDVTFQLQQSIKQSELIRGSTQMLWSVNIDLNILWDVTVNMACQYIYNYTQVLKHRTREFNELLNEKFCKVLYYGYFFLLMSLRFPQSILQLGSIEYENIPNLYIIAQLQHKAKDKNNELHKINFQKIWMNFYQGLKSHIVQNMQLLLPGTKIPNDIETKLIQRLLNDINKQKPTIVLNLKILSIVQNFINKYVKQEKPKVLHELKTIYESMLFQLNVANFPMIRKKSSQMRRLNNEEMKITVKQIEQVKQKIQELSQNQIHYESQGIMKQIADIFEDVKRVKLVDNEQSLKDVIYKKMLSRRQVNVSELLSHKSQHEIEPFESSIILENRTILMNENGADEMNLMAKETSLYERGNMQDKDDSLEEEYFHNNEFKFDSIIQNNNRNDESKNNWHQDEDYHELEGQYNRNIQQILIESHLPYLYLISPQQIINRLASKDSKFENKFHLNHPIPSDMIEKIQNFSKLITSYELYYQKNSQYYLQENLKKMLTYSSQNILQILQQIYFDEDSILVTLNPKQLETNSLRKSRGLGSQEQKFTKAKMPFILDLIKALKLHSSLSFQDLLNVLKENESIIFENKDKSLLFELKQLKKIFPLSDLTSIDNGKTYEQQIETIFGRVYLSEICINDQLSLDQFRAFVNLIEKLLEKLSQNLINQTEQEQKKRNYTFQGLRSMLSFMMIVQIIRQKNTSETTKKKLQYLLFNISKQFILQIHELIQSLLLNSPELLELFTLTVLKKLNPQ